eukprot:746238-Hanusia_phi.AAC.3
MARAAGYFLLCASAAEAFMLPPSSFLPLRSLKISPTPVSSSRSGTTALRAHAELPSVAQAMQVRLAEREKARCLGTRLISLSPDALLFLAAEAAGKAKEFKPEYAQESYYATLGLYLLSLPGAWSLIKRSVEYKPINKVYETKGPSAGKEVRQTAAEITAYFRAMNFAPEPSQGTITFRGTMGWEEEEVFVLPAPPLPIHVYLAPFVRCLNLVRSLASLALVLTVQFPLVEVRNKWKRREEERAGREGRREEEGKCWELTEEKVSEFSPYWYMTLASPLAGFYYWAKASKDVAVEGAGGERGGREGEAEQNLEEDDDGRVALSHTGIDCWRQVKLEESEDGSKCEISTLGSKEELERFCEVSKTAGGGRGRNMAGRKERRKEGKKERSPSYVGCIGEVER